MPSRHEGDRVRGDKMPKHSGAARLACVALAGLLIAAALFHSGCSDPLPDDQRATPNSDIDTAEIDQTVPQQAQTIEPMDSTQDVNAPDTAAGATLGAVGAAQAEQTEPEDRGAIAATMSEPSPQAEPQGLEFTLPESAESVNLYAGPGVDWAVRRIIQPSEALTILGRAPQRVYGLETTWLKVEFSDNIVGWLHTNQLTLEPTQLDSLPELHMQNVEQTVVVRSGAYLRYSPDGLALPVCQISSSAEARINGRDPDGQWFLVNFDRGVCINRRSVYNSWVDGGWVRATQVESASVLAEVPIVLRDGRWSFSSDPRLLPSNENDGEQLGWESAIEEADVNVLRSPTGEHVLARKRDFTHPDHGLLSIIDRSGRRTDIGKLYMYHQSGRYYPLGGQAHWSPDGRAIVMVDFGRPSWAAADHLDFWLYDLNAEQSVDLRGPESSVFVSYYSARFHPDGRSIYVTRCEHAPRQCELVRLTRTGGDWPDFTPIPINGPYLLSAWYGSIITTTHESGLLWSNQGEQLGERRGTGFHWLPDSERFAYYADGEFVIEHLSDGVQTRLKLPARLFLFSSTPWLPDGRHFAAITYLPSWRRGLSQNIRQLRIYNLHGEVVSAYRLDGCADVEQLVDPPRMIIDNNPAYCHGP